MSFLHVDAWCFINNAETLLPTLSDKISVDTCIANHAVRKFYTLSEILFLISTKPSIGALQKIVKSQKVTEW